MRAASSAPCSCSAVRPSWTPASGTSRCWRSTASPTSRWMPAAAKRWNPPWPGCGARWWAACACRGTRPATASASPRPWQPKRSGSGSSSCSIAPSTRSSSPRGAPWRCAPVSSASRPTPSSVPSAAMAPASCAPWGSRSPSTRSRATPSPCR